MNSLYQQLNGASSNSMTGLVKMLRNASNPQALLQTMAQQNPQIRQVMQIVQQNGGDAKSAFYKLAQERGINPEEILNQLR